MQNRLREKWKIRVMSLRTMLESQCDSEQKYCNGERRIYLEILRLSKCKYGQSHPPERKRDNDNDITFKQANWKWLSHASSVHQAITFANTLFPCFVSTSGLATTRTKKIKHKDRASRLIKRALFRAYLQGSISAWEQPFEFQVPSVLGTIRISSIVCDLESYYSIKPPILPAILGLSWYMVSRLRPFEPVHSSSQAWLDQQVYGSSHLYELVHGFDPEGLAGLGFLGSLLTGLLPSPASKLLWTPTSALEMLGQRSLEVYLISAGVALGLEGIGIRDIIYQLINNLLIPIGFHDDHQHSLSKRTSAHVLFFFSFFQFVQQRKHDPAAYDYSPSFQAVPQTYDFANLFELHALELAAAITSTSHSGSGTKSDGSSIAYLLMPSSSTNPLLSSMFNDQE
ncbi:hypothetical protein PSTT_16490, partial [Puccinia striiformis]